MRPQRGYVPRDSIYPLRGVNFLDPSTLSDPRFSPDAENVLLVKGRARSRYGYEKLGEHDPEDDGPGGVFPCNSRVMAVFEYETLAGARHLLAITQKRQYRYDAAANEWVDITPVDGSSNPEEWTGGDDDQVHFVVAADDTSRRAFITNGKDTPREWDGTGTFEDVGWDIEDFVTCKTIEVFFNRLVIGGVETTSVQPTTVAWSVVGDFDDWTGPGAGAASLSDVRTEITRLISFGDRLAIYGTDSISVATLIGGEVIFSFETLVQGTSLLSGLAIVNLGPFHLFAAKEDFYLFDGTRMILPVGERVALRYREEVFLDLAKQATAFHDAAKRQVWWLIPNGEDGSKVVYLLEYDLRDTQDSTWTRFKLADPPTTMGTFRRFEALSWNSSLLEDMTWEDVAMTWDQGSAREDFPVRIFGSGGGVFLYDDIRLRDNGETITSWWDSIDFVVPEVYQSERARWLEVELELRGTTVEVQYSIDQGSTYTSLGVLELTSDWQRYQVLLDVNSRLVRFRLIVETSNDFFELRWLRAWLRPAGAR